MCESGLDARPRPHVDPEQTEEREACTQLQLALIINWTVDLWDTVISVSVLNGSFKAADN